MRRSSGKNRDTLINSQYRRSTEVSMKMSFRRFLSRFRLARRRTLEPSYYLIDNQPRPRRGIGHLKMLGTAVTSILGTLLVTNQLYQGTKTAGVELELHRTYSGFEVRAINRGGATATAVDLTLATWPHGAPARWVQSDSLANIPPRSERALLVDMVPASLPAESRDQMHEQMERLLTSAYIEVSCGSCSRPRIYAFSIPGWHTAAYEQLFRNRRTTDWPMIEVRDIDRKPPTGECVDFPHGVRGDEPGWSPTDIGHASRAQ
jgi:hypothetical protein